jgi:hypothetical protein
MTRRSKTADKQLTDRTVAWKADTIYQRLQDCRAMLAVWGYLTSEQNRSIQARLEDDMGLPPRKGGRR